jgi:hypothetical protein
MLLVATAALPGSYRPDWFHARPSGETSSIIIAPREIDEGGQAQFADEEKCHREIARADLLRKCCPP